MQKYRLLKDLPLAKAGTIVSINKESRKKTYGQASIMGETGAIAYIPQSDITEWLEEIPEKPKSVYDLRCGDIYYICTGTKYIEAIYGDALIEDEYIELGMAFVSLEELEKERKKRKAIAKIHKYCFKENICIKRIQYSNDIVFRINDKNDIFYNYGYRNGNPLGYFSRENAKKNPRKLGGRIETYTGITETFYAHSRLYKKFPSKILTRIFP